MRTQPHANIMRARQIKAARDLLGWLQSNLASHTGLSIGTIRKVELGEIGREDTMLCIKDTFENHGLEFLDNYGVRQRPDTITTYSGSDGVVDFFDDILQAIKKNGREVVSISRANSLFGFDTRNDAECVEKLAAIKSKANIKCLLMEDSASPLMALHCECRSLSKNYVDPAQYFVYGDKYAVFETSPMPKIIVIRSLSISDAMRQQFYSMWDKATSSQAEIVKPVRASRTRGPR